jgi:pimeloyl-ACP methyl ester carboxylesterase
MVVTLLHGFMQDGRAWDELVGLLPAEWTVIRPDLAGQTSIAAAADAVPQRSHLVGYSMGGRVALWLAAQHPDRVLSITTISAHAGLEPAERAARAAADQALAERIESEGMDWFAGYWAAQPMFARLAGRADLDAISAPALFIAGSEDGRYPALARRLAAAVPQGRAEIVAGAGHAVHLERPAEVAALLRAHVSTR